MGNTLLYNKTKKHFITPEFIRIEITQKCTLKCRQCYCNLNGDDMDYNVFKQSVLSAKKLGVRYILLTGGEPLLYPHINECITLINEMGMKVVIATSGVSVTENLICKLYNLGLHQIYVSLNGSNHLIHNLSRENFEIAIKAIEIIKKSGHWCGINWVARKDNYKDFPNFVKFAKSLGVDRIDILSCKQSLDGDIELLNENNTEELASYISKDMLNYIFIELCYPELRKKIFNERENALFSNCLGGKMFFDIYVDGSFSPCRHTKINNTSESLYDYWNNSNELDNFRKKETLRICQSYKVI